MFYSRSSASLVVNHLKSVSVVVLLQFNFFIFLCSIVTIVFCLKCPSGNGIRDLFSVLRAMSVSSELGQVTLADYI